MSWVQRVIGVCRGRPGIARLALVVYIVVATGFLVDDLQTALHRPETTDYLAFAGGARVLNSGSACLYCDGAERSTQIALLGHAPPDESGFPNRFVNPPLVALALRPLGALSLDDGLRLFTEALLLCLAIAALVAAHRVGAWPRRNALTGLGVVLATFSLPGLTSLRLAQWAPLLLVAAMGSLAAGDRRRWFVAGLSLSVLLIKPQLVWLCVPLILVSGRRRLVAGFVVGAAAWAISGVAILGPQHVGDWFSAMSGVGVAAGTEGVPGLAASIWGRPGTIVATSALGVVTVLMAWRLRGLLAAEPGLAISLGIALSLAFSPHAYPDDLLLLAVPLVLWVRLVPRAGAAAGAALSLAWLWDVHVPLSVALRHSEAVVACVIALGAVWLVSRGPATDAAGGSMSPGHRTAARPSPSPAR